MGWRLFGLLLDQAHGGREVVHQAYMVVSSFHHFVDYFLEIRLLSRRIYFTSLLTGMGKKSS